MYHYQEAFAVNIVYLGRERIMKRGTEMIMGTNRTEADIVSASRNSSKYEIEVSSNRSRHRYKNILRINDFLLLFLP